MWIKRYQLLVAVILSQIFAVFNVLADSGKQPRQARPSYADQAKPIRIGVSLGLTGRYAELGRIQQLAYQLWESHVNQRGGILKRPVKLIIQDDKSDPQMAVKIYKEFTEVEKLDFVFGPYSSPITAAVASITEKNGYPMLAAGAASDEIWKNGYQNLLGVYAPASRWLNGFFAILSQAGLNRVAVVTVDDSFSMSVAEGAKRWAPEYDIQIVDYRVLIKKNPDLQMAAKAARDAGADALIMAGHYEESVNMRRVLKQMNWMPKAYYASSGPGLQKYYETLGPNSQGTFYTSSWEPREDLRIPGSVEFLKAFRSRYNEIPSYQAASAYAAGQILEEAISKAGTLDRPAVRQALFSMDTNTIVGRYAVDRIGLQGKRYPLIVQWHGDKREIIWPQDLQTAAPIVGK